MAAFQACVWSIPYAYHQASANPSRKAGIFALYGFAKLGFNGLFPLFYIRKCKKVNTKYTFYIVFAFIIERRRQSVVLKIIYKTN